PAAAQRDRLPSRLILHAVPVDDPRLITVDDVRAVLPQPDSNHAHLTDRLELARAAAYADDAAGEDRIQLAATRFLDQFVALGARIDPDLADLLALELRQQPHRDIRLHIHGC